MCSNVADMIYLEESGLLYLKEKKIIDIILGKTFERKDRVP